MKSANLAVVYQSNRQGTIDPCGCETKPFGGLDREFNAVEKIRLDQEVLFLDGGNMLAQPNLRGGMEHQKRKSEAMVEMLNIMGLDAFSPGPLDYGLGVSFLESLSKRADFPFVSSNVVRADGSPLFNRFIILKKAGLNVGIISLTPDGVSIEGARVLKPIDGAKDVLSEMKARTDLVVALSQTGTRTNEEWASELDGIHIWVGADPQASIDEPFWYEGGGLLVDGHAYGYQVGFLNLSLNLPIKRFFSKGVADKKRKELQVWREKLALNPKDPIANLFIGRLEKRVSLERTEDASLYENQFISLDEKRFGKKNILSRLIRAYKQRIAAD